MSNETKRDVFGKLLNAYQNLVVKDIEMQDENYRENVKTPWNIVYEAALPDDLPVIPEVVGVSIKEQKEKQSLGGTIFDAIFAVNTLGRKGVGRVVNWIVDNNEVFALAWVLGVWRVEETGEIVKLEVKD